MSRIITLTTDFSTSDAYVGMMKGVILSIAPDATIVDLAHDIHPHDIFQAAFVLETTYCYFPEGTVHVVVVDPGVGSVRRRLAMKCGRYYFVGPDNGVFTYPIRQEGMCECVEMQPPAPGVSLRGVTFEGRDIFGPAAARLAAGAPLHEIGTPTGQPMELDIPRPRRNGKSIEGRIIYIDHFGNCMTNIELADVEDLGTGAMVSVGGRSVGPLRRMYAEVREGDPLALINSLDHLEIAVNQGNAEEDLNLQVGTPVRMTLPG